MPLDDTSEKTQDLLLQVDVASHSLGIKIADGVMTTLVNHNTSVTMKKRGSCQ